MVELGLMGFTDVNFCNRWFILWHPVWRCGASRKSPVDVLPVKKADEFNSVLCELYSESVFSSLDSIVVLITFYLKAAISF